VLSFQGVLGQDGLEGSFAAFRLKGWPVVAANVPYSEGTGALTRTIPKINSV